MSQFHRNPKTRTQELKREPVTRKHTYRLIAQKQDTEMILQLPNMDTDAQRFGLTSDIVLGHQLNCTAPPSLTLEQELTNSQEHQ